MSVSTRRSAIGIYTVPDATASKFDRRTAAGIYGGWDVVDLAVDTAETTTITDIVSISLDDLVVSISDETTIIGVSDISLSDIEATVYSSATVAEDVVGELSDLVVDSVDTVTVSEDIAVSIVNAGDVSINITDLVSVADVNEQSLDDLLADINDAVTIEESVSGVIVLEATVVDAVTVAEDSQAELSVLVITAVDEVIVVDIPGIEAEEFSHIAIPVIVESVTVSEYVAGIAGDVSLTVFDSVSITDTGMAAWLLSTGYVKINVESLIPIISATGATPVITAEVA